MVIFTVKTCVADGLRLNRTGVVPREMAPPSAPLVDARHWMADGVDAVALSEENRRIHVDRDGRGS